MCPFLPKVFQDDGDMDEVNTGVINPPNSPISESESSGSTDGFSDSSSSDECETDDENPLGGMLGKIEKEEKGEGEDEDEKVENEKGEDEEDGEEEEEDDEEEDDDEGENWSSEVGHLVGNSFEEFGEVTLDSNFDIPPIPVGESSPQTVPNRFSIEDSDAEDSDAEDSDAEDSDAEDSDLSDCSTFSIYEQNSHHEPMEVSKTAPPIENFPNMMEVDLKSLSNEEIEVGMVQVGLQSLPHKELEGNLMQVSFEPLPNIELESDPEIINVEPDNMVEEQEINNVESVPSNQEIDVGMMQVSFQSLPHQELDGHIEPLPNVEIEPETINVEPENMNVNKIARAKPIPKPKKVDPEELVLAESRRKSLRSANVPAPVAAVNKRKRPSSAKPKPKKKVARALTNWWT